MAGCAQHWPQLLGDTVVCALVPGASCGLWRPDGKGQIAQGRGGLALTLALLESSHSENSAELKAACM